MKDSDKKKIAKVVENLRKEEKALEDIKSDWEDKVGELEEKDTGSSVEQAEEIQEEIDNMDQHISNLSDLTGEIESM